MLSVYQWQLLLDSLPHMCVSHCSHQFYRYHCGVILSYSFLCCVKQWHIWIQWLITPQCFISKGTSRRAVYFRCRCLTASHGWQLKTGRSEMNKHTSRHSLLRLFPSRLHWMLFKCYLFSKTVFDLVANNYINNR
jgi:hypothetical protein